VVRGGIGIGGRVGKGVGGSAGAGDADGFEVQPRPSVASNGALCDALQRRWWPQWDLRWMKLVVEVKVWPCLLMWDWVVKAAV
jgi:hypothetical protein